MSAEVPQASKSGQRVSGDRLSVLEGKLARMEARPRTEHRESKDKNKRAPAVHNGKDVCFHYNSYGGCKRQSIPKVQA